MSRRHGKTAAPSRSGGSGNEVERLIARGALRDALKQARVAFRQSATAENRDLLQRVSVLRIEELLQGGMPETAREIGLQLLELGVSDSARLERLVLLLPRVGLAKQAAELQGRLSSPEAQNRLTLALADRAVLDVNSAASAPLEMRDAASQVRVALAAVAEGDDEHALELLQQIPRSSPLADWRLFVRGLVAFYRGDDQQTAANWDRLDPHRAACRMAGKLRGLPTATNSSLPATAGGAEAGDLSRIEVAVFGEAIIDRLRQIDGYLVEQEWKPLLAVLAPLRHALRRVDVRLAERLSDVLLAPLHTALLSRDFDKARLLFDQFTQVAEPLPIDPRWRRLWALVCEQGSDDESYIAAQWRAYIDSLGAAPNLPVPPAKIQALAWRHLAHREIEAANQQDLPFGIAPRRDPIVPRTAAAEALRNSILADPTQRATHDLRLNTMIGWNLDEEAAAAAIDLLAAFPDDVPTLQTCITLLLRLDRPREALEYLERLAVADPTNASLVDVRCWAHQGAARKLAMNREWDAGRAHFDRADELLSDAEARYRLLARRATFEQKAGDLARAEQLRSEALALVDEPAPVFLVLAIEAALYKLPAKVAREYTDQLEATLFALKASGATAATLAITLGSYAVERRQYRGEKQLNRLVVKYLAKLTRIKCQQHELEAVIRCLLLDRESSSLREKLINRGLRLFPRSAAMCYYTARHEYQRGPFHCDVRYAKKQLAKAKALLDEPGNADADLARLVEGLSSTFQAIDDAAQNAPGGPRGGFRNFADIIERMAKSMDLDPDDLGDELFDDFDSPFEFGDYQAAPAGRRSASRKPGKRKP